MGFNFESVKACKSARDPTRTFSSAANPSVLSVWAMVYRLVLYLFIGIHHILGICTKANAANAHCRIYQRNGFYCSDECMQFCPVDCLQTGACSKCPKSLCLEEIIGLFLNDHRPSLLDHHMIHVCRQLVHERGIELQPGRLKKFAN